MAKCYLCNSEAGASGLCAEHDREHTLSQLGVVRPPQKPEEKDKNDEQKKK